MGVEPGLGPLQADTTQNPVVGPTPPSRQNDPNGNNAAVDKVAGNAIKQIAPLPQHDADKIVTTVSVFARRWEGLKAGALFVANLPRTIFMALVCRICSAAGPKFPKLPKANSKAGITLPQSNEETHASEMLRTIASSGKLSDAATYQPATTILEGMAAHKDDIALRLKSCNLALQTLYPKDYNGIVKHLSEGLKRHLACPPEKLHSDAIEKFIAKSIRSYFKSFSGSSHKIEGRTFWLPNSNVKVPLTDGEINQIRDNFKKAMIEARGKCLPKEVTNTVTICANGIGIKPGKSASAGPPLQATETVTNIDVSLSAKLLAAIDKAKYGVQIQNIEAYADSGGARPSAARFGEHIQGMIVNGRSHAISTEENESTYTDSVERSGAFAVHDEKKKIGLSELKVIKQTLEDLKRSEQTEAYDKLLKKTLKKLSIKNPTNPLEAIQEEIDHVTHMTISQGIPKICNSIKKMAATPESLAKALAVGSFLHVEQCSLSDMNTKELKMIQDMEGAMDYIRENISVGFTTDPAGEKVEYDKNTGKFRITLHTTSQKAASSDKSYGIQAVFLNQGLNEAQSLGHFKGKARPQDKINERGIAHLLAYGKALEGTSSGPEQQAVQAAMASVTAHYSADKTRLAKDVEGIDVVDEATRTFGGKGGKSCKSGKDRTALMCARILGRSIARMAQKFSHHGEALQRALLGGASYKVTGQNTGKPAAYAINTAQRATFPNELIMPDAQYCGSVAS